MGDEDRREYQDQRRHQYQHEDANVVENQLHRSRPRHCFSSLLFKVTATKRSRKSYLAAYAGSRASDLHAVERAGVEGAGGVGGSSSSAGDGGEECAEGHDEPADP